MKDGFSEVDSRLQVSQECKINSFSPILGKIQSLLLYAYWRKRVGEKRE